MFFNKKIGRREFLKDAAIGTAGIFIGTKTLTKKFENILDTQQSIVTICRDVNATSGSNVNQAIVQVMVDESIKNLTGLNNIGEAWKSLFPGITQTSVIGIKVNALYGPMSTNPEVVNVVINGLALMDIGGNNFIKNKIGIGTIGK